MSEKTRICVGELVQSLSGHDAGELFLVVSVDEERGFAHLCDGKNRKATSCKRKNLKHIVGTGVVSSWIEQHPEKVNNTSVRRELKELRKQCGR